VDPFAKRGEMDQGILTLHVVFAPAGRQRILNRPAHRDTDRISPRLSKTFAKNVRSDHSDPSPVSPLAWLPLGLVLFLSAGKQASELGALFTIGLCAMWPTVLNTACRSASSSARLLERGQSPEAFAHQNTFQILLPAALPQMFTGFRLSLGIAWLVIVAAEMLTGALAWAAFSGRNTTRSSMSISFSAS